MGSQSLLADLSEYVHRARPQTERLQSKQNGERTGSRPSAAAGGGAPAPALRPADRRATPNTVALIGWGRTNSANLGRMASRERGYTFSRRHPRRRRRVTRYSRDINDRTEKPQRTGSPACAGADSSVWSGTSHCHCEEQSDEAIHLPANKKEWIASLRSQ
jgi:hypothetical protein